MSHIQTQRWLLNRRHFMRRSVLDEVLEDANALRRELGKDDRTKLAESKASPALYRS